MSAAGAFAAIESMLNEGPYVGSGETSAQALAVLRPLMLGQAQECIVAKVAAANVTTPLLAQLEAEAAELYDQTHTALLVMNVSDTKDHPWQVWQVAMRAKSAFFRASMHASDARRCDAEHRFGDMVARYRAASSCLDIMEKVVRPPFANPF